MSDDNRLQRGLDALAEVTSRQADALKIERDVMRMVRNQEANSRSARRWWLVAVPAVCAAAMLVLFLSRGKASHNAVWVSAKSGASVASVDSSQLRKGEWFAVELPARVATAAAQRAVVHQGYAIYELAPNSDLQITPASTVLHAGVLSVDSLVPIKTALGDVEVQGNGRLMLERAASSSTENEMKLLKKHAVVGVAVAAVAVYAGWATFGKPGSVVRVEAPGGAYLDHDGVVRRFGLDTAGRPVLASGSNADEAEAKDNDAAAISGAYWNEDKELVLFRVPGEVVDADSGEPIRDFEVEARVVSKGDYGQGDGRSRSQQFTGRDGGTFVLEDLGQASWQITVRAEGYSPLIQSLDLVAVDDDPYLFAPLSNGARLSGRVVDTRGEPVEGADVGLAECFRKIDRPKSCSTAKTKSDGSFSLAGVPQEEVFAVRAEHPRYGVSDTPNLRYNADASQHVTIELSGVVRIFGEVSKTKDRLPVPGAQVASGEGVASTDNNGVYEMFVPLESQPMAFVTSVPGKPKSKTKIASYPDNRSAYQLNWVSAETHVAEVRIDFQLEMENGRLFGQVTDAAGKPMAGLELDFINNTGWARDRGHETFPTMAITDVSGRYSLDHVPVSAGYVVRYRNDEKSEWRELGYVNVRDDAAVEANFRVGNGAIRGLFTDAKGNVVPLGGMACQRLAARLSQVSQVFASPRCFDDGKFEFTNLQPGKWVLENRVAWMDGPVEMAATEVNVGPSQIVSDVKVQVKGEGTDVWKFRVLSDTGRFVGSPYVRYKAGENTSITMSLQPGVDGTAQASISRKYKHIFLEAPGYESQAVDLSGKLPSKVQEIRLTRSAD